MLKQKQHLILYKDIRTRYDETNYVSLMATTVNSDCTITLSTEPSACHLLAY